MKTDTTKDTNFFEELFYTNQGPLIHKWHHYFEVYERHFARYKGKDITFLEIGISHGGSLRFWTSYFGKQSKIYAIDINPECKKFETDQVKVFIGSQEDRAFLASVRSRMPQPDILLDDGGHTMRQQIVTFEELYSHVKQDGVYAVEDTHTSYWPKYGGGYKRRGTFMEYSKSFIDYLHALYPTSRHVPKNEFARSAHSLHYYPGIVLIERRLMQEPKDSQRGLRTIADWTDRIGLWKRFLNWLRISVR